MTETRGPIRALIVILLQCSDTITVYYRTTHRGRVTTVDTSHNISIIDFLVYQHFFTYIYISIYIFIHLFEYLIRCLNIYFMKTHFM